MKRLAIISFLGLMLLGSFDKASAQFLPDVPNMKGKVTFGGDFDFGMYGHYLNFAIAPQVGYRIFSPWEVGVRGVYNLFCYFDRTYGNDFCHYFGVSPYTNCQVYKGLFVHAEYECLYGFERYNHETYGGEWFRSIFVGGGYRMYSEGGNYYYLMLLYNLSYDNAPIATGGLYPYVSPLVLRVGFCF